MRHYGLPTRLLDWTPNLMTAAFFATHGNREDETKPGVLWALAPGILNHHFYKEYTRPERDIIFAMDQPPLSPSSGHHGLLEYVFPRLSAWSHEKERDRLNQVVAAVMPPEIDPRMMMQQSTFTLHGYVHPLEAIDAAPTFLMKFTISRQAKRVLASQLHEIGTRRSMLFPDLESLATCITERVKGGGV
jgi:hypothetical protein